MVGRLAGRLVISGGRITTGTTPEVMGERIACRGMREGCEENNVQFMWETSGTCGYMWGTRGEHGGWGNMWVIGMQTVTQLLLFPHQHRGRRRRQL